MSEDDAMRLVVEFLEWLDSEEICLAIDSHDRGCGSGLYETYEDNEAIVARFMKDRPCLP